MLESVTAKEMARAPVGKYVAGDSFVHFCAAADLWGVILWGRPSGAEAYRLGRSLIHELGPAAEPHVTIFDASRLVGSDPDAFRAAHRYLETFSAVLEKYVTRLALVRPAGLNGAVIAGAFDVLPQPFPVTVADSASAAFAWLAEGRGAGSVWPTDGAALIASLHAEASGAPTFGKLRAHLEENLVEIDLAAAARALGVSSRTLQRQLKDADTTFSEELAAARIRAARRLLVSSEASLTEIAMEVGCKSLQQFSALFRRRVGESPSNFRTRRKASG